MKTTAHQIRARLVQSGTIHSDSPTIKVHKAPVIVSRLNAILARRESFANVKHAVH